MGWDAFSTAPMAKSGKFQLKHKKHRDAFLKARRIVLENADTVDGYLSDGSLNCSACRDMLQEALQGQFSVYTNWSPEDAKMADQFADWNFKYDKENAWAYWSARLWLKTIAHLGLGVNFSY